MELSYEVRQTQSKKGKGLFATRDISENEVILSETPLVSVQFAWNRTCKYSACQHCMKPLETAQQVYQRLSGDKTTILPRPDLAPTPPTIVKCSQCIEEYCSEDCLDTAYNTYHKVLCTQSDKQHPVLLLIEAWKNMHYPPETTNIMLIARLIAQAMQSDDASKVAELVSSFCGGSVNEEDGLNHKLLGNDFQGQIDVIRRMLKEAMYMQCFDHWYTPEGFRSLLAMIGKNGQGIGTNSFSLWAAKAEAEGLSCQIEQLYERIDEESGDFEDCEGSGLFLLQSACNHECNPSAEISFPSNNHVLVVKALRNIKKGEEISISYLPCCDRARSRHSRQKILRENYLFICNCSLCTSQAQQDDVTSEEEEEDDDDDMDTDC